MLTYASYLDKKTNLVQSGMSIVALNISVSIMAGLAIFPAMSAFTPVSETVAPRTRPSVGFRATQRTVESPRCCSTSRVITHCATVTSESVKQLIDTLPHIEVDAAPSRRAPRLSAFLESDGQRHQGQRKQRFFHGISSRTLWFRFFDVRFFCAC